MAEQLSSEDVTRSQRRMDFEFIKTYKKLHESNSWRDIMCLVGDDGGCGCGQSIQMRWENNSTWNCSKLGKNADSLDHLYENMYTVPKYILSLTCPTPGERFNSICYVRI